MGKPKEDIPKINLYQKRKICFIVSDKGDALFVELSPQRKGNEQAQLTEGSGFESGVATALVTQSTQEASNHSTAKPPCESDELRRIYDELLGREISQLPIPEYKIYLIVDILSKLTKRNFREICLRCLDSDKVERDKIAQMSDAYDKACELCEYFDTPNRGLIMLVDCIEKYDKTLYWKIVKRHREEVNQAK